MNLNNKASIILTGLFLSLASMVVTASETGLQITNQWVREAPPMASMLAGYLHIRNNTDGDMVIVGVSSPAFRKIEIHRTELTEGVARMVRQKRIEVPAKGPRKKIIIQSCLSFGPASALWKRLHRITMRPFLRLESEPKSCAIFGYLIISATLKANWHLNKLAII